MKVNSYSASLGEDEVKINVQFATNDYEEGMAFRNLILTSFTTGKEIDGAVRTITPEKIFRCGNATTVIWKDGTKTTVKLMPGAEDSDYGAFTAALAKKIYGGNSKVMRYAGMVQRVKSKAEKKATRKLKRKYEEKIIGEKEYIVSQYGQVYEYRGAEDESLGYGQKFFVRAKSEDEARGKAVGEFRKSPLKEWLVLGNGSVCEVVLLNAADSADGCFGRWMQSCIDKNYFKTCVFAKDKEEAKKALTIIPVPLAF